MSDDKSDILRQRVESKGHQVLPPIVDEVAERLDLDLDDDETRLALYLAVTKGFWEGIDLGFTECAAQAIEQGAEVTITSPKRKD